MPHASKPSENGHYDHGVLVRVGADAFGIPHGGGISRTLRPASGCGWRAAGAWLFVRASVTDECMG